MWTLVVLMSLFSAHNFSFRKSVLFSFILRQVPPPASYGHDMYRRTFRHSNVMPWENIFVAGWSCMTPFRRISCNRFLPFVHFCSFRNRPRHHQVLKHVNKKMKCLTECSFPERNSFLMLYSLISDFPVNRYIVTSGGTRKKRYCRVYLYTVDCTAVTIRAWNI